MQKAITQLEDVLDFVRLYYKDNLYLMDKIKAIINTLKEENGSTNGKDI